MIEEQSITRFIDKAEEGSYFPIAFVVPEDVAKIDVRYQYDQTASIIDFALSGPDKQFVGASGSDRAHLWVSAYDSSPGFLGFAPKAGEWEIIVGAYQVPSQGVEVTYEIIFTKKERQLLKGDTHTHTVASDGVLTTEELAKLAMKNDLDFLFITDHNNFANNQSLTSMAEMTLIPGVEWTLFKGHANMLGVKQPFQGNYYANSLGDARQKLQEAKDAGAFVSINHPFDDSVPWQWGFDDLPFDGVEVWNGIIRGSNLRAIHWWHEVISSGKRLPILGGSDFHRFLNFSTPGMPTMGVYSLSRAPEDILSAIRNGHSFITFQPSGPFADIRYKDAEMGDVVEWDEEAPILFQFDEVYQGDVIKIYSEMGVEKEITAPESGTVTFKMDPEKRKFYRAELHRLLLPGLPPLLCLITNPIYFS